MNQTCRLCGTQAQFFHQDKQKYFRCPTCRAIFTAQEDLPNESSEKERYELHDTEIDKGYKNFVSPIISHVVDEFSTEAKGLDFGSGRSKVISKVLEEHGVTINSYDPFFENNPELLEQKYDYITSCEVIEHFYEPNKEFTHIKEMLKEGGKLYLMTEIYNDSIDFASWYYKNDPTHVFFYTKESFEWIQKRFSFQNCTIHKRLVVFSN
ncbi:class I SAM-dependent methyltransferase [Sulfurimonas microaerophilic]|uniref:class I SAM-dependent methyltransferase n=1 Tax=Sulfurimonas microaerophilic TaxID=3058392 RepID=UPI002714CC8F|nr:class I SAM-dependent methyltransferase [Sulfurimonas sp. hsl 1-7]